LDFQKHVSNNKDQSLFSRKCKSAGIAGNALANSLERNMDRVNATQKSPAYCLEETNPSFINNSVLAGTLALLLCGLYRLFYKQGRLDLY
jgi:hypothetical protein